MQLRVFFFSWENQIPTTARLEPPGKERRARDGQPEEEEGFSGERNHITRPVQRRARYVVPFPRTAFADVTAEEGRERRTGARSKVVSPVDEELSRSGD